jgi:hypothetical protein
MPDSIEYVRAGKLRALTTASWTKKTVDDPVKEAKYTKSFALYVGGDEVYDRT